MVVVHHSSAQSFFFFFLCSLEKRSGVSEESLCKYAAKIINLPWRYLVYFISKISKIRKKEKEKMMDLCYSYFFKIANV